VKFLVFDMDGVLVDTSGCHARAYGDLWRRYGVEGPEYASIAGRPTREVVEAYTRDVAEWTAFKQARAREYLSAEPVLFDDVRVSMEAIHRAGWGMGVATGASRATAEMLLARAGIGGFFQFVLAAEDVSRGKPDPEIYRRAADLAGAETIVIEDSAAGLQAAAAASSAVACVRTALRIESPFFLGSYPGLVEFTRAVGVEI
jgi:HAD superfamily hydrolase (TIGR01509 family)